MTSTRRELLTLLHAANRARMLADDSALRARAQRAERAMMAAGPITDPEALAERDTFLRSILVNVSKEPTR